MGRIRVGFVGMDENFAAFSFAQGLSHIAFVLFAAMAGAPLTPSELVEVRLMLSEWRQYRIAFDTVSIPSSEEASRSIVQ